MSNKTCDTVAERIAIGEPLGDLADHAASCVRCRRLAALPVELATLKRDADPGMGFSSRVTAAAQHRLVVRRRRRIAAGAGLGVAAAAAIMLVVTHQPEQETGFAFKPPVLKQDRPAMQPDKDPNHDPWKPHELDNDVRTLVRMANVERHSHLSANWGHIEKSLAPYRAVLKGTEP